MTRFLPKTFARFSILGLASFATPLVAQSMTAAQCDAMMMAGTQNYSTAAVASCTPYFQSLAQNAVAPGTFATTPLSVNASTSGTGG